jgi:hypothetical protein
MILTPVDAATLPSVLGDFARRLTPRDAAVLARIATPPLATKRAAGAAARQHREAALQLATSFGMATLPGTPALGFSWDGRALRRETEAYVLLHEVAHFQLAAPERRRIVDFGLGAGPETGARAAADRAARVFGIEREREEAMASLLGILREVELGQPALASFLDQNWLEGADRPAAPAHFAAILARLRAGVFLDRADRPTRDLRAASDRAAA